MGVIKSRRMMWMGHVACMGKGRGPYRILVEKSEEEGPLGRPRYRWEDNEYKNGFNPSAPEFSFKF
jgi:hypothetical protein